MPPRKQTAPWVPVALPWEGGRFCADGARLRLVYVTSDGVGADRADVRRDPQRLTVTLSRMQTPRNISRMAARLHCVELQLSSDGSDRILVDGATGERAPAKRSRFLDSEQLRATEETWDSIFEPREFLDAREVTV